jgi:hypothetical protein
VDSTISPFDLSNGSLSFDQISCKHVNTQGHKFSFTILYIYGIEISILNMNMKSHRNPKEQKSHYSNKTSKHKIHSLLSKSTLEYDVQGGLKVCLG